MRALPRAATVLTIAAITVGLAGCSTAAEGGDTGETKDPVVVGSLTSLTGPLSPPGVNWAIGFEIGLEYATDGTNQVDGIPIEVIEADDQSDPSAALAAATDLVSRGATIITGTQGSGIATSLVDFAAENDILYIVGAAGSDAFTGAGPNTFRGGRQGLQDAAAVDALLGDRVAGAHVCQLADDTAYGHGFVDATRAALEDTAGSFGEVFAPFPSPDVSPYVQQIKDLGCDIMVLWVAGEGVPWYKALIQQDVFADTLVVAPVQNRSSWSSYIDAAENAGDNLVMFATYIEGAGDNAEAEFLQAAVDKRGVELDFSHEDGFIAALMVAEAVRSAQGGDVAAMIKGLEGFKFVAPSGDVEIRAKDHAILRNEFAIHWENGRPVVDAVIKASDIAPPVAG